MSTWQVRESGELGKETRLLELRREGLSVGRSSDCDVQLLSRTVEERHAVFEWNQKKDAFAVRDLGSVNGTYVNNQPLRDGATVLRHGDSIRFGYEKIHLFRVEVVEALPSTPQPPLLPQSAVAPPQPPLTTLLPQSAVAPPQPPLLPLQSTVVATQTPPLGENYAPHTTLAPATSQPAVSVQYIPIPSQPPTIIIPTMQPAMPYMVPQTLAYGYSPVSPAPLTPISLHPPPPGNVVFQPVSSAHSLPQQQPATPTSTYSDPILVEDIETSSSDSTASRTSSKVAGTPRSDGRRSVAISAAPNLSKGSMLYGKPSWWGEEAGTNVAPELGHQGSTILRDLSPERVTPRHDRENSAPVKVTQSWSTTRVEAELRKQAISNSQLAGLERDQDNASPGSWVIEFGSGQPRRRSFTSNKIRRPRSADPSPSRVGRTPSPSRRSVSPVNSPRQSPLPRQKVTSLTPSPLPQKRGGKSDSGKRMEGTSALLRKVTTKKPPTGPKQSMRRSMPASTPVRPVRSTCRSTVRVKPIPVSQSLDSELPMPPAEGVRQDTNEDVKVERDTTYTVPHSENSIPGLNLVSDKLPLSSSPTSPHPPPLKCFSDTTMVIGGGEEQSEPATFVVEEERPYSARKQWKKDQAQPRDSLMLASIEARMRRLSKMAQTSAMALSSLQPSIEQRGGTEGGTEGGGEEGGGGAEVATSPSPNSSKSEQELPEWKFFNKDVDSIFQNIRAVEKWLRDIDNTVASLQMRGMEGEELGGERVDYHQDFASSDSEADLFEDSIEDLVDSQLDNSNTEEL